MSTSTAWTHQLSPDLHQLHNTWPIVNIQCRLLNWLDQSAPYHFSCSFVPKTKSQGLPSLPQYQERTFLIDRKGKEGPEEKGSWREDWKVFWMTHSCTSLVLYPPAWLELHNLFNYGWRTGFTWKVAHSYWSFQRLPGSLMRMTLHFNLEYFLP